MKYIVYLTTNKINNKIYIGVHQTIDPYKFDGYLGCGIKINDRHSYVFGKYPLHKAVTKYGPKNFIRSIIKIFDNREDALKLESELVDLNFIKRSEQLFRSM